MKNKLFLVLAAVAMLCGCTKQQPAAFDFGVFDEAYYYMSTAERDSVWSIFPADSLVEGSYYVRMHDAFAYEQQTSVGSNYVCGTLFTPAGEAFQLSDYVGKTEYVLLDFWASWCPPCRALMPMLKEVYAAQPEGKLQIVGISLDAEKEAWVNAIEKLELPWVHASDLAGWGCETAGMYGVFCIPTLVLLDSNGTIIARGCDEEAVLAQIK